MRYADLDQKSLRSFGRNSTWLVALSLGQIYAAILFLTIWMHSTLTLAMVETTELFIVVIAIVAVVVFGWMAARPWLSHALIYGFAALLTMVIGRLLASLIVVVATGTYAWSKDPAQWMDLVQVIWPATLAYAITTAVFTLFIPEILALLGAWSVMNMMRGRFPEVFKEPA